VNATQNNTVDTCRLTEGGLLFLHDVENETLNLKETEAGIALVD